MAMFHRFSRFDIGVNIRTPKAINGLFRVTDKKQAFFLLITVNARKNLILNGVSVLKLIN